MWSIFFQMCMVRVYKQHLHIKVQEEEWLERNYLHDLTVNYICLGQILGEVSLDVGVIHAKG
jgi:hypothetical protein